MVISVERHGLTEMTPYGSWLSSDGKQTLRMTHMNISPNYTERVDSYRRATTSFGFTLKRQPYFCSPFVKTSSRSVRKRFSTSSSIYRSSKRESWQIAYRREYGRYQAMFTKSG